MRVLDLTPERSIVVDVSTSYAAAERHADTHGGARIEIEQEDT